MFKIFLRLFVIGVGIIWQAPYLWADILKKHFFTKGDPFPLVIDTELVAIKALGGEEDTSTLSEAHKQQLATLGLKVIRKSEISPNSLANIIGIPVWFGLERQAIGIMTQQIILKSKLPRLAAKIPSVTSMTQLPFGRGLYRATFSTPIEALEAANNLHSRSDIQYSHPDFILPKVFRSTASMSVPEDEFYSQQWHLANTGQADGKAGADSKASDAWAITKGSPEVKIAVIDGGFEVDHPDFFGSWQTNLLEIAGDNLDNDRNGFVDDVLGWNFWMNSNNVEDGAFTDHGTSVAGIVASPINNRGIVGVCPGCRMFPLVIGSQSSEDAAAFYYAKQQNAAIITNSWGYAVGTPTTDIVVEAISEVAKTGRKGLGTLILFAMNNINQDDCVGPTPDISSLEDVIAVSGASNQDKKVSYSAWGDCMEILAPTFEYERAGIVTTDRRGRFGYNDGQTTTNLPHADYTNTFGGTSAATPIVAGVLGLMLSIKPDLTRQEALGILLSSADKINPEVAKYDPQTGFSRSYGYGRVNAHKALSMLNVLKKVTNQAKK